MSGRADLEADQRAWVAAVARTWAGTPYHHHGRIKGVGVDCAMLLCEVYASLVGRVDPGEYAPQWGLHRSEELYIQWIEKCGGHQVQTPGLGDIAVFRFGRTFSHGGILVGPELVLHAYIGAHVMYSRLTEAPLDGRETRFYSLWGA
jgi:cell wall-associated NlpC family hydrolase